jgi:sporulation protein YlmC with PRC-barrel domain
MPNIPTLTAVVVILSLTAPAAFAQTAAQNGDHPVRHDVAFTTDGGQLRAGKIIGSTVYDVQNRNIGSVKDVVLDRDGRVAGVVVDVGSFLGVGGKYVSVGLSDLKIDNDRLTLNRTKEQLQAAQAYPLENKANSSR